MSENETPRYLLQTFSADGVMRVRPWSDVFGDALGEVVISHLSKQGYIAQRDVIPATKAAQAALHVELVSLEPNLITVIQGLTATAHRRAATVEANAKRHQEKHKIVLRQIQVTAHLANIAKAAELSLSTVRKILAPVFDKIMELDAAGLSRSKIASRVGVCTALVDNVLRKKRKKKKP